MKFKMLRIRWGTWIKLRRIIPGKNNETMGEYIDRVANVLKGGSKDGKETNCY